MKSKIQTNQILKKGMAILIAIITLATPIAYATTSLDDSYLDTTFWEQILYGKVGSTAREIEEWFKTRETLYISNEIQLRALAEYVNNGNTCEDKQIILLNNIEVDSTKEWIPIGSSQKSLENGKQKSFKGIFDGKGYTISGINFSRGDKTYTELREVGLFGYAVYANIKNVVISNSKFDIPFDVSGDILDVSNDLNESSYRYECLGAIAGMTYSSTISNCIVEKSVYINGLHHVGGLVGYNNKSDIKNCKSYAAIYGFESVGGIAGANTGAINNLNGTINYKEENPREHKYGRVISCVNEGTVHGENKNIGGIAGNSSRDSIVQNCENKGMVTIPTEEIRYNINGKIVSAEPQNVGGIVGCLSGDFENGTKGYSTVDACINNGVVRGYRDVGGIVGQLGALTGGNAIFTNNINYSTNIRATYTSTNGGNGEVGYLAGEVGGYGKDEKDDTSDDPFVYMANNLYFMDLEKYKEKYDNIYSDIIPEIMFGTVKETIPFILSASYDKDKNNISYDKSILGYGYAYDTHYEEASSIENNNSADIIYLAQDNYKVIYNTTTQNATTAERLDRIENRYKLISTEEPNDNNLTIGDLTINFSGKNAFRSIGSEKFILVVNDVKDAETIIKDIINPNIETKAYVENALESGRYTAGKEIVFEVKTNEAIKGTYTLPELQISFSKSGIGKYNYDQKNNKVGFAKCIDAKINLDGTTTWKYLYQIQEGDEGKINFKVVSGAIEDLAGNKTNLASTPTKEENIFADTTAPTVEINVKKLVKPDTIDITNSTTNGLVLQYTFTWSEEVIGFDYYDINVINGNKGEFSGPTANPNGTYSYTMNITTQANEGNVNELKVIIAENACQDKAGLGNISRESIIVVDKKAPTVEIKANKNKVNKNEEITYEFIWTESVKDFVAEDIVVTNGTKGTFSGSGNHYTLRVTPNGTNDVEVSVSANKCNDIAGNVNIASSKHVIPVLPSVTITAKEQNPTNQNRINYEFVWSEEITGFDVSDIILPEDSVVGEKLTAVEDNIYTITIDYHNIIQPGAEREVTIGIKEGAVEDLNGNYNTYTTNTIMIDRKAPTVEIKASKDTIYTVGSVKYDIIWSEPVIGFTEEDITIVNGEISDFKGSGNHYTFNVLAVNSNDLTISIKEKVCTDKAGNDNIASSKHVIPVLPAVTITTDKTSPTNESEITYTFTWSESVLNFNLEDIIVPSGINKGELTFVQSGVYTMAIDYDSLIPAGNEGEVEIAVKENAVHDSNRNYNAYTSNTIKIDRKAPIFESLEAYVESDIELDSNVDPVKQHYKEGDIVNVIATFTESIESSTEVPVLALQFSESGNAKGTISQGTKAGNKITYTYTITDGDTGLLSVKGFSGKVIDGAGNETIVTKRELVGDTIIADTTTLSLVGLTAIAPDFEYDELLQDSETKRYGVESKTRDNNTIIFIAEFSEDVYCMGNEYSNYNNIITSWENAKWKPSISIQFGKGNIRSASYLKVEGNKVYFTDSIKNGDNKDLRIRFLNDATYFKVSDIAGNILSFSREDQLPELKKYESEISEENRVNNIIADTTKVDITFTSVTAVNYDDNKNVITGNGTQYRKGSVITVEATTSEYVYKNTDKSLERFTTATAPVLSISFSTSGAAKGNVVCSKVEYIDNKTKFTYTYEVKEGDNGQLKLDIAADTGYDIALNGNNVKSETKSIYADTVNPVTNWQSWVESEKYGIKDLGNGTWEVTFSEKLYVYDNSNYRVGSALSNTNKDKAPKLLVTRDNTTALETTIENITTTTINGIEKTVITYKYADYTKNIGAYGMKLAGVSDKAGNLFNLKDQIPPMLQQLEVISPEDGTYKAGQEIKIVATFNEKLNESSQAPVLALKFDVSGDAKGVVSAGVIQENKITYTYTITANDNKGNGDNGTLQLKLFGGTGLKDLADNEWVVPENITLSGKEITADTILPVITKVEAIANSKVIGSYTLDPENYVPGRTNADTITYKITFSEPIDIVDENKFEVINARKTNINCEENIVNVIVKTTYEGVQSLIIHEEAVQDLVVNTPGNRNEYFRFNGITTDFTKPVVRFISEYNGGEYVLPTGIGKVEIRPNVEISEDIAKIEYKWDNGEYAEIENYSSSSDIAVPTKVFNQAGNHTLYIKVVDIAGNVTIATKEYNIKDSGIKFESSNTEPTNQEVIVTVGFEDGLTDNRKVTFKPYDSNEKVELNAKEANEAGTKYEITENGILYAEATDKVGNKVYSEFEIDNIDKVAPTITGGKGEFFVNEEAHILIKSNELAKISYSWDREEWTDPELEGYVNSLSLTKVFEEPGNYNLYIVAEDKASNKTRVGMLVLRVKAFEIEISGNSEVWTKEDITLEITANGIIDTIEVNGTTENVQNETYVVHENGEYEIVVIDEFGNEATERVVVNKIDKIDPEITDVKIENGEIVITANDKDKTTGEELSGIAEYAITDTTEVPVEWSKSNVIKVTKDENFFVWAKDNVGNIVMKEEIVVRDVTAPELTIETDKSLDKWTKEDIKVNVKTNEKLTSLVVKNTANPEVEENILESKTYTITANGTYEIVATDRSGNKTTETIKVARIDKDLPVITNIEKTGKDITITATDEVSEVKEYAITTTTEVPVEWSKSNVIKITKDGIFYVWAKDSAGNITRAEDIVVVDTTAPTITFSYLSQTVTVGMPIEANVTTNEDAIISYSWDKENWINSEELISSLTISKKSTTPGKYTLYVKAKDGDGNESKVQTLEFNVSNIEDIKQPDIVFEDIPTMQVNGARYVKVSTQMTKEMLLDAMNKTALCGVTPEYINLSESNSLKTGTEIKINGQTKYIVIVNGDVNCDGKVDFLGDVVLANNYRIGQVNLSMIQKLAADINNNGIVDFIPDIVAMNNYRLGIIKAL